MELAQATALPPDEINLDEIANIEVEAEEPLKPVTKIPRPLPPAPVIIFEEPPEPPSELPGVGVNKKVIPIIHIDLF